MKNIFITITYCTSLQSFAQEGYDFCLLAYKNFDEGVFDSAVLNYTQCIAYNPADEASYFNRGLSNFYLENWVDAANDFNKVTQLKPGDYEAYLWEANALSQNGSFEQAVIAFSKSIYYNPDQADAYFGRGFAKYSLGMYQDAIDDMLKTLATDSSYIDAHFQLGLCYMQLGNYDFALRELNTTVNRNQGQETAWYYIGYINATLHNYNTAIEAYTKVIVLNYEAADAYYERGIAYFYISMQKEACSDWQTAFSLGDALAEESLRKYCK
jgi:tetratricopeptide (TPR) repeat protein